MRASQIRIAALLANSSLVSVLMAEQAAMAGDVFVVKGSDRDYSPDTTPYIGEPGKKKAQWKRERKGRK